MAQFLKNYKYVLFIIISMLIETNYVYYKSNIIAP